MGQPDGTGSRRVEDGLLRKTQTGKRKKRYLRGLLLEGRTRARGGGDFFQRREIEKS